MWRNEVVIHVWWECKVVQLFKELPGDPAVPLPGMHPKEMKMCLSKNIAWVVTAVLFLIAPKWKQPKCPLTNEWINKMWSIHTMEYYSTININDSTASCCNVDEPWKHYAKWKAGTKDHILHDSFYGMMFESIMKCLR